MARMLAHIGRHATYNVVMHAFSLVCKRSSLNGNVYIMHERNFKQHFKETSGFH